MSIHSSPKIIDLEITNYCNTVCSFCPRDKLTRPHGLMTQNTFIKIINQLKKFNRPYIINFSGLGECTLHPKLADWIKIMKKQLRCFIGITTNGTLLTNKLSANLLQAKPDFITISYNGEKKILMNIKTIVAARKKQNINIHLTTLQNKSKKELTTFGHKIGIDGIIKQKKHNRGGYLSEHRPPSKIHKFCQILKNSLFITWDGKLLSCCHDLSGTNELGNIHTESLLTILKKHHRAAKKKNPFTICHKCNDILRENYFARGRFIPCKK